jgi:chromosome partitioning protein
MYYTANNIVILREKMIVTVAHQKGGVGKSTIATNLAVEMGIPIIDLDSQHSCYLFSLLRKEEQGETLQVFTPETVDEIRQILENINYDKVIIDSGGYDNDLNRFALLISDVVITPVSPSQIEVFGLLKFAEIIEEAKKYNPYLMVHILINNADPRSSGENRKLQQFIEKNSNFELLRTKLHRRADYRRAYSEGLSVCEYNPGGKACKEVKALIIEISTLK